MSFKKELMLIAIVSTALLSISIIGAHLGATLAINALDYQIKTTNKIINTMREKVERL